MKIKNYDGTGFVNLKQCPFCGSDPALAYCGNSRSKIRKIEVKCTNCKARLLIATRIRDGFLWLEDTIQDLWNKRTGQ